MIPVNIKQESKIIFLLNLVQKSIETGFFTLYLDFRKRGLSWILLLFSILLCVHYIYRHQSESYVFMHDFIRCLPCRGFFFSEGGDEGVQMASMDPTDLLGSSSDVPSHHT